MNKQNFIKHANAVVEANKTWDDIIEAIGGDFENGLTRVMDVIPEMYAQVYHVPQDMLEMYYDCFWALTREEKWDWDTLYINNWGEFFDYFFTNNDR